MARYDFDAVVLGLNVTGLGIIQALGERKNIKLAAVDTTRLEIGFFSRYGSKFVCEENKLLKLLISIGSAKKKIIIYPTSDEFLIFLSRNEEILSNYYYFPFPQNLLVEQLLDKYRFYLLSSKYTKEIPKCCKINDNDAEMWNKWPAIVKPVYIHEFRKHFPNCKALIVRNSHDFRIKRELLKKLNVEAFLQEIVKGKDSEQYSVCVYINNKNILMKSLVTRKVRQSPAGFGIGTYVEIVDNSHLENYAINFLNNIGFIGIAEVEYRKDENDGKLKLIEVNSRPWTQNKLASYGGCDIIGEAYSDFMGKKISKLNNSATKWFFLLRDIQTCFNYIKKKDISFYEFINSYSNFRKHVGAFWNKHDILVTFILPLYILMKLFIIQKKN